MMLGIPFYMSYEGAWSRSKTIFTGLCLYSCFVFSVLAYSADPITDLTSYTFGLVIFGVCCLLLRDGEKMFRDKDPVKSELSALCTSRPEWLHADDAAL